MVQVNGGDEITPDDQMSDYIDPGYDSDSERKDKGCSVTSEKIVEQKLYPDNCLRFDWLSCANPRGIKLNKCYGEFYGGQVTAILGPSGSGRSTLLKILAGIRVKNSKGRIKVGNVDRTTTQFKSISSYIPHHCIISNLTVKETLQCSAIACCPSEYTDHERNKAILKILDLLLTSDIIHRKVYDLTLVEQKILCLAAEYLRSPRFIFIQDPLSDLSIQHQMFYMTRVKILAQEKIAVVMCLKSGASTASLQFVDQLYVLAEGQVVYSGLPGELNKFFKDASDDPTFPDIQIVLSHCAMNDTQQQVETNETRCRRPITGPENHVPYEIEPVSCLRHTMQGFSMCSRYSIALARQVRAVAFRLIYYTFLGVLMGGICFEVGLTGFTARENAGYIFFSIIFLFLGSMVASARRTSRYMCIYQRERFNRWYSSFSFYLAKMLAELPVEIIMSVPFASITYFMAGNPANLVYFVHIALCVVTACMGHVFGVVIMAVSQKFEIQQTVAGVYITVNTIIMGYIFRVKYMPTMVKWAAILSPFHMLFKSFVVNIYNSLDPLSCPVPPVNCSKYPPSLLYMYGFEGEEFKKSNFAYLFAHLAFLHAAAFVSIAARGRWFDSELPRQHFNKSATICVTQPPLASSLPEPPAPLGAKEGILNCLRSCITCKPYKPLTVKESDCKPRCLEAVSDFNVSPMNNTDNNNLQV
ncbi:ATP-binding cassette sub-family G member 4-like isoform X3 [Bolinopsis microptera]|uniref:ATP-binding cassette sub-family G member 4-like isoform X3 n=1 Tax=Bolinopsis microptera TaxID=2820187 RepID=UPI00307A0B4C